MWLKFFFSIYIFNNSTFRIYIFFLPDDIKMKEPSNEIPTELHLNTENFQEELHKSLFHLCNVFCLSKEISLYIL